MPPETTNIYISTEVFDNVCKPGTFNIDENQPPTSTTSLIRSDLIFNNDHSVQDPNYDCNIDISVTGTKSELSESLISSRVKVNEVPDDANEFQTFQVHTLETTT